MSTTTVFKKTMVRVYNRRYITPNQNGRKSPLRQEVEIREEQNVYVSSISFDTFEWCHQMELKEKKIKTVKTNMTFENEEEELDECDIEVRNILMGFSSDDCDYSDNSSDSFDYDDEELFGRSKCPAFFF